MRTIEEMVDSAWEITGYSKADYYLRLDQVEDEWFAQFVGDNGTYEIAPQGSGSIISNALENLIGELLREKAEHPSSH